MGDVPKRALFSSPPPCPPVVPVEQWLRGRVVDGWEAEEPTSGEYVPSVLPVEDGWDEEPLPVVDPSEWFGRDEATEPAPPVVPVSTDVDSGECTEPEPSAPTTPAAPVFAPVYVMPAPTTTPPVPLPEPEPVPLAEVKGVDAGDMPADPVPVRDPNLDVIIFPTRDPDEGENLDMTRYLDFDTDPDRQRPGLHRASTGFDAETREVLRELRQFRRDPDAGSF